MNKNVASQKVTLLAIDISTNAPKTGDAANLTAYVSQDDGAVTPLGDTSATELDAANAPGLYTFDLTQAETNADKLLFSAKSSTANIRVIPLLLYTVPASFTAFVTPTGAAVGDSSGVTTLLSRLSATRAGYLDNLSAGAVALEASLQGLITTIGASGAGVATAVWGAGTRTLTAFDSSFKTGYALSAAGNQAIWDALTSALTTVGSIGKLLVDNINATISSRLASASYTAPATAAAIADQVWEEALTDHSGTAGSTAEALGAAGSAGDPWATALPGSYTSGQAGKIIGDNLDAAVSTRLAASNYTAPPTAVQNRQEMDSNSTQLAKLGTPAGLSVSADIAAVKSQTAAIELDTQDLQTQVGVDGAGLTALPWNPAWDAEVESEVADALEATVPDSIPADGTRPSVKSALYLLTQFMLERSVAATTVTVKKPDGSTTLFTLTVNDATTPTSVTRAT